MAWQNSREGGNKMRLRHKSDVSDQLEEMKDFVFTSPDQKKGSWRELFKNDYPLRVELGVGKGGFITAMAKLNCEVNHVGIERVANIIAAAAVKRKQLDLSNLFLVWTDVEQLESFFAAGEVDRIYLNFSDPWPKKRHEKRRLTSRLYLDKYKKILKSGGEIHFKTDDADFFEYSLMSFAEAGFSLRRITRDLAASPWEGNILTEYEQKFMMMEKPICRCEAITPQSDFERSDG